MAIFVCPKCSHTQKAPEEYIGRTARCMKCESTGSITANAPLPSPSTPSLKQPPAPSPPAVPEVKASSKAHEVSVAIGTPSVVSTSHVYWIIGLLSALLVSQLVSLMTTGTSNARWEYTIEAPYDSSLETSLERLGNEGWELVSARRATGGVSASYEMIFRRAK